MKNLKAISRKIVSFVLKKKRCYEKLITQTLVQLIVSLIINLLSHIVVIRLIYPFYKNTTTHIGVMHGSVQMILLWNLYHTNIVITLISCITKIKFDKIIDVISMHIDYFSIIFEKCYVRVGVSRS